VRPSISTHGSAAIRILAQFCKRARHLLRPYRGWGSLVFNAIHIETTASSSSDVATRHMN
jgi:hypothetical protein